MDNTDSDADDGPSNNHVLEEVTLNALDIRNA